jgi:hypothetical protein
MLRLISSAFLKSRLFSELESIKTPNCPSSSSEDSKRCFSSNGGSSCPDQCSRRLNTLPPMESVVKKIHNFKRNLIRQFHYVYEHLHDNEYVDTHDESDYKRELAFYSEINSWGGKRKIPRNKNFNNNPNIAMKKFLWKGPFSGIQKLIRKFLRNNESPLSAFKLAFSSLYTSLSENAQSAWMGMLDINTQILCHLLPQNAKLEDILNQTLLVLDESLAQAQQSIESLAATVIRSLDDAADHVTDFAVDLANNMTTWFSITQEALVKLKNQIAKDGESLSTSFQPLSSLIIPY